MINRKKALYYIFCTVFITIILLSNKIIASLNYNNVKVSKIDIRSYKKDMVYYSMDGISIDNDLFDSFFIKGWAFCETSIDNSQKEVWALLVNDKETYTHKMNISNRDDVRAAYINKYKIKGVNHGVIGTVSTIGMKNGIYNIYIYCKENTENYGLVDTGMMLKKDGKGISEHKWESTKTNISTPVEHLKAKSNLDSVITAEEYFQIDGWAFADGVDSTNQAVYVRLLNEDGTTATYNTQRVSRPDVGTAYKSDLYDNSGFKAVISADALPEGDIEIQVLIENGGNVYLASKTYMYSSGNLMVKDSTTAAESDTIEKNISAEVEINSDNIIADSKLKYNIESCVAESSLGIKGWAYIGDKNASDTSVYLAVTKADGSTRVFTTAKISRLDVATVFKNEIYTESGFQAEIPLDTIGEGDNIITVIAENDEIVKAEKTYNFNCTAEVNK